MRRLRDVLDDLSALLGQRALRRLDDKADLPVRITRKWRILSGCRRRNLWTRTYSTDSGRSTSRCRFCSDRSGGSTSASCTTSGFSCRRRGSRKRGTSATRSCNGVFNAGSTRTPSWRRRNGSRPTGSSARSNYSDEVPAALNGRRSGCYSTSHRKVS